MNEITDWKVTPQYVTDMLEEVKQAKRLKEEQIFLQGTFTTRMSIKEWAERFMQEQPIDCTSWSNLTDIGDHFEQSSTTQQQPESPEVVGAGLSGGTDYTAVWQLGQCFARSGEMQRFSKKLQEFAQTIPDEEPCAARADELLLTCVGKVRHSSSDKKKAQFKNYWDKPTSAKRRSSRYNGACNKSR